MGKIDYVFDLSEPEAREDLPQEYSDLVELRLKTDEWNCPLQPNIGHTMEVDGDFLKISDIWHLDDGSSEIYLSEHDLGPQRIAAYIEAGWIPMFIPKH